MNKFSSFSLGPSIQRALQQLGFDSPTPIQSQAIPLVQNGHDIIGCAQTGTGKTGAFAIPLTEALINNPKARVLVLAPTRELALQIDQFWRQLLKFTPSLKTACLIGGSSYDIQRKALRSQAQIWIATPGRLLDHAQERALNLNTVTHLVLDEADRMLDMGFAPQLNEILDQMNTKKQTLLFTATWDKSLDQLSSRAVHQPKRISVGEISQAAPTISQEAVRVDQHKKNELVLELLSDLRDNTTVLIFARTQARTDRLAKYLSDFGLQVGRIHGGRSQGQRNRALQEFKSGRTPILVATDIAARGIDVKNISKVFNFDLPQVAEDYIHRIGRTGRAGAEGYALSLVAGEERSLWRDILRLLGKSGSAAPAELAPRTDSKQATSRPEPLTTTRSPITPNSSIGAREVPKPRQSPWQASGPQSAERRRGPDRDRREPRNNSITNEASREDRRGRTPRFQVKRRPGSISGPGAGRPGFKRERPQA